MLSDDAFREQLVDYLYGTLEGPALAEFEAALAASPARRAELDAMRSTLVKARAGLAMLHEEPPARLRTAVLDEAWRLAVARGDVPMRRSVTNRSATWLVPALGIAAAVAFVVLRQGDEAGAPIQKRDAAQPAPGAPASPTPSSAPGEAFEPAPADAVREQASEPAREPERAAPARQRAPTAQPKGAAGAAERREAERREVEGLGGAAPSSGGAPPEKAKRSVTRGARDMEAPVASEAAPAAAPSAPSEKKSADVAATRAPDERVEHAEELARDGHREQAAAAYRALLARYPDDPRARAWREALTDLTDPPR